MKQTRKLFLVIILICAIFLSFIFINFYSKKSVLTSGQANNENFDQLSNKKIEWGIKRADNHEQPDVGSTNKKIMDEYEGLYLGNKDQKYIYLTFDLGYEAGYTSKIIEVLKNNDVKATFFITAHYLNTQEELVKQMIEEGHIIGNHTPKFLMPGNDIKIKC